MSKVLIIGAGGVGGVVAHKCADGDARCSPRSCSRAARSRAATRSQPRSRSSHGRKIRTAQVDADDVAAAGARCSKDYKPAVVINVALPYQDLHIMDACLEAGVDYLDTANYEPRDVAKFEYKWQWAYQERFAEGGPHGAARLGLRSGRDQRVLRVRAEAPARRDPLRRHRRLQRRQPRQGVRDQLQSRDQHPRDHRARPLLGERRVEGDRAARASRRSSTSPASARRRASCSITRSSSRSRRTSRASSASASG